MAASLIQYVEAAGTGSTVTTGAVTTTNGNTFLVLFGADSGGTYTVSDSKGNTYTQIGTYQLTGGSPAQRIGAFICFGGVGGAGHTASVTPAAGTPYITAWFAEVTGVSSVDAGSISAAAMTSPFTATGSALAQAANLAFSLFGTNALSGSQALTETTGWTAGGIENDANTYWANGWATKVTASTAALTSTWTATSSGANGAILMFALKEAGGGTSLTPGHAALTLTGPAPTVARTANQSLSPAQKAITLTGQVPTVARTANVVLSPAQKAISITGFAPTVSQSSGVNLSPATRALAISGQAPTIAQSANVNITLTPIAFAITGHAPAVTRSGEPEGPTNENDIGGGQKRREVYWRPLLQRMLDARAEDRPPPPKGRAKVRAKAIEQDAARLVLEGDASVAQFNALLERWTAQHDVEDMPRDPLESFAAAMRFRVEQTGDVDRLRGQLEAAKAAKAAKARKDDEDAALLMLLA